jgi:SH3 domain protein
MLPSGTEVEVVEKNGDFVRIKLKDGTEGWARSEFISAKTPASLSIKQVTRQRDNLQAQLNAIGVTEETVKRLQRQLAKANRTIKGLRKNMQGEQAAAAEQAAQQEANQQAVLKELMQKLTATEEQLTALTEDNKTLKTKLRAAGVSSKDTLAKIAWLLFSMSLCLAIGFGIGTHWLGRLVRKRFNGRKVW